MNATEAQELGSFQARNRAEDFLLGASLQARLEAHEIPHLRRAIFLTQLHDRVGLATGLRIDEADRLHRPKAQCLEPALRHFLDRQAALEIGDLVKLMSHPRRVLIARDERRHERFVLALSERRVPVVVAAPFAVARRLEQPAVVERVGRDDRRDRVVERQRRGAESTRNRSGERVGCQRTRRDDSG